MTNAANVSNAANVTRTIAEAYGLEANGVSRTLKPFSNPEKGWHEYVPKEKSHIFTKSSVNDLQEYEYSGFQDGPLFVTGPKGAGKSSTIEQFYARLGKPMMRITGHERLEVADMLGLMTLQEGKTVYQHGPLTLAAKYGGVFLFDEADACPPEVLVGLHGILEMGDNFIIPENGGEVIKIHPGFRVIVTGNTAGSGDEGDYAGTVIQNSATLDRFNFLEWGYPSKEVEMKILIGAVPALANAKHMAEKLLDAASETRGAGIEEISTRTLVRWARKVIVFQAAGASLQYSLDRAFTNRLNLASRAEVYAKMRLVFGEDFFGKDGSNDNN